ncbi:MAG: hypothetical protein COC01_01370 [Bacteroidetes bacterium]|nr:MAG: hypothetical protein COC01_01370 [Bacteroidota bacterium]
MKRLSLIVFFASILCTTVTKAQEYEEPVKDKVRKHEISLGISSILSRYVRVYDYYGLSYSPYSYSYSYQNPDIGIGYKFHLNNIAFRFSADIGTDNSYRESSYYDYTSKYFSSLLRLGVEWEEQVKKLAVYYGLEAIWGYYESEYEYEYDPSYYGYTTNNKSFTWKKSYGGSPLIGVKYKFNKLLSISSEAKLDAIYHKQKTNSDYAGEYNTYYSNGMDIDFNPMGLLILNIHL